MKTDTDTERLLEVLRDNFRLRGELARLQERASIAPPAPLQNYQLGLRARIAEILREPRRPND